MKTFLFQLVALITLSILLLACFELIQAQDSLQTQTTVVLPPEPPSHQLVYEDPYRPSTPSQDFVHTIEELTPLAGFIAFFLTIVTMFKAFFDYRLKSRMVEKGISDESLKNYFLPANPELGLYDSLKWGLVAAGLGLGLTIANYLPIGLMSVGVVVLFTAIGFIGYFMVVSKRFLKED
ncbi:MAG: hypothetical protein IPM47_12620 [Sphingobacteriales bacterium]|nr:MAG: hypothetical protein IPM47_12620 [Sphingobacteriales bacterium]